MASKTQEAIVNAYLSLLKENDFDKITVTDLVEKCSISRQTFYYHFDGIEGLIFWAFDTEFEEIMEKSNGSSNWLDAVSLLIPVLKKYNSVIVSTQNSQSLIKIQRHLSACFNKFSENYFKVKRGTEEITSQRQKLLIKYMSSALTGLIYMELDNDDFSYENLFANLEKIFLNSKGTPNQL